MNLSGRSVFLLDGIGALISAIFTGLVLPRLYHWTGLPPSVAYAMVIFPLVYSSYSFGCYLFLKTTKRVMLIAIIIANLFYCFVSTVIIFILPSLTMWGSLILLAEIVIVLGVVAIEFNVYRKLLA